MTHSPPWWRRDSRNEADNRLVRRVVALQELRGILLRRTTNLTDHDDAVRRFILQEDVQAVDEVGSGEWIAANANYKRLSETGLRGLVDGFICEGARPGDDTDAATLVDEARHDTDLALALQVRSG